MSRSLRNRSSRYSSPATFGDKEASTRPKTVQEKHDGQPKSLDKWVEPTVRNAVPSFEDTKGLERLGVLEHMAPLGVPPSSKLLQKLKVTFNRSSPRMTPVHTDDAVTPTLEAAKLEAASPTDTDFLPEPVRIPDAKMISSPPRGRPAKKDAEEMRLAFGVNSTTPSPVKRAGQQNITSPRPQSIQDYIRQDRIRSSVKGAIDEASRQSNEELIPGLELLLEDAKSKASLWSVLDAVVNKSPTDAQFKVFKRYIKQGIRQYRESTSVTASPFQPRGSQNIGSSVSLVPDDSLPTTQFQTQSSAHRPERLGTSASPSKRKGTRRSLQDPIIFSQDTSVTSGNLQAMESPAAFGKRSILLSQPDSPSSEHSTRLALPARRPASNSSSSPSTGRDRRRLSPPRLPSTSSSESPPTTHLPRPHSPSSKRSRSASTSSSLSSAKSLPDDYPREQPANGEMQLVEGRPVRSSGQRQAVNGLVPPSRTRSSGTANQPDSSHVYSGFPTTIKFVNKKFSKSRQKDETASDATEIEERRHKFLSESFQDYNLITRPESSERTVANGLPIYQDSALRRGPVPTIHPHPLVPSTATLLQSNINPTEPEFLVINGNARKRTYDEMDRDDAESITSLSSSPALSLVPPPPAHVRGSTPRASRMQPPNKVRKSARVMISPNKPKNGGITAGMPRGGQSRDLTSGNATDSGGEDNDEFCASCGGEGTLLCCDGCTNSFHHACLEPPLNPDDEVDGEWFCPQCISRRNKQPLPTSGLMTRIIRRVDDTIPKAYSLPFEIRDYFEGVKTGDEGEYEEISLPRTQNNAQKMNRAGFFEQPNYKELRDSKGNFITCYKCGETSNGRDIIPCDFCPAKWHTDCIDPPLAVPPRRTGGDKPNGYWRCPLHIEPDLTAISRQADIMPEARVRIPRLRRPKKAIPIDVDMDRGFRNNGMIEIELMKDEMPDIKEVSLDGGIYRIPEKGIRLDFIDRVKKSWYEDHVIPNQFGLPARPRSWLYRPGNSILHHPAAHTELRNREVEFIRSAQALAIAETAKANARLRQKSFVEQSAVMSLVNMAEQGQDEVSIDPLSDLVNQLIADAPKNVETQIKSSERESLLRLQELVHQRLALLNSDNAGVTSTEVTPEIEGVQTRGTKKRAEAKLPYSEKQRDNKQISVNGDSNQIAVGGGAEDDEMDTS